MPGEARTSFFEHWKLKRTVSAAGQLVMAMREGLSGSSDDSGRGELGLPQRESQGPGLSH